MVMKKRESPTELESETSAINVSEAPASNSMQSNDNVILIGDQENIQDISGNDKVVVLDTGVSEKIPSTTDNVVKPLTRQEKARQWCCPNGITKNSIPISLAIIALAFTAVGSWDCSYFVGATTGFTGNHYGLWTLENYEGACQLWDVIFFSYNLGGNLIAARALSMTAMVLGLSLLTAMSQALQTHIVSWGVGLILFALFIVSISTTSQYNLWTLFFLFFYIILVLIVRALFIHPVHRVISSRGSKYIAWLLICNFVCTLMTLLVLKSYFCQCTNLTAERLEGRVKPNQDLCKVQCELSRAGIMMVIGSGMWFLSGIAVSKYGVQPKEFQGEYSNKYAGYSKDSITTRAKIVTKELVYLGPQLLAGAVSGCSTDANEQVETGNGGQADDGDVEEDAQGSTRNRDENAGELAAKSVGSANTVKDENEFHRTWSQKLCCDYRIAKRSRMERYVFCCFRCGLTALVVIFIFIIVILSGSRYEKLQAESAPSTSPNFITNVVCAFNESNRSAPFVTYDTSEEALADNMTVAHCGACAYCSNMEDIETYVLTRQTIAIEAKTCGKTAVLGSTEELDTCLEETIGFSKACRTCWVENMKCDSRRCIFTCMKTLFTGFLARNNVPESGDTGRLNWCLQCDEKICGTAFVTCSGVARRRLGIESAIERNVDEICPKVEFDWDKFRFQ